MAFTDPFIRRPVLASVISLLIVLLGIQAFNSLTIRQYPQMESALITVTTAYPGANAETIQGYITQPLQQRDDRSTPATRRPYENVPMLVQQVFYRLAFPAGHDRHLPSHIQRHMECRGIPDFEIQVSAQTRFDRTVPSIH